VPEFAMPRLDGGRPLHALLVPAPCQPEPPAAPALAPVPLRLVRDDRPRAASAAMIPLSDLIRFVGEATTWQLDGLRAVWSGQRALVRGERLPALAGGTRLWGRTVLVPLGFRPDPDWPESALRDVLGLRANEIAVLTEEGVEILNADVFAPVTRAGVRAGTGGNAP
jgi:hypothetical protein